MPFFFHYSEYFFFVEFNGGSAKAAAMTLVVLLDCFLLSFCLVSLFPCFPSSSALCRYLLPRLRVSPMQHLSVPLQHACMLFFLKYFCSSCSTFFTTPVGCRLLVFFVSIVHTFMVWCLVCFVVFPNPVRQHFTCLLL